MLKSNPTQLNFQFNFFQRTSSTILFNFISLINFTLRPLFSGVEQFSTKLTRLHDIRQLNYFFSRQISPLSANPKTEIIPEI